MVLVVCFGWFAVEAYDLFLNCSKATSNETIPNNSPPTTGPPRGGGLGGSAPAPRPFQCDGPPSAHSVLDARSTSAWMRRPPTGQPRLGSPRAGAEASRTRAARARGGNATRPEARGPYEPARPRTRPSSGEATSGRGRAGLPQGRSERGDVQARTHRAAFGRGGAQVTRASSELRPDGPIITVGIRLTK